MPEQETEAVTEVTGEHDDYLSYDTAYINEKLLSIDNKLSDVSSKFDHIIDCYDDKYTLYTDFIGTFDDIYDRVDVMYQSSLWNMLLLGLISGILFVLVFTGGKK